MDRRQALRALGVCGAGSVVVGLYAVSSARERARLRGQLEKDALPLLAPSEARELDLLPGRARQRLATWFHAPCLNAAEFVYDLCSSDFQRQLRHCSDEQARHELVSNLFVARVVSIVEMTAQVEMIAEELGHDLDRNWISLRSELLGRWRFNLSASQELGLDELVQRVEPLLEGTVEECIDTASVQATSLLAQRSSQQLQSLGTKALLLIPAVYFSGAVWPWFVVGVLWQFADWYWESINHRIADLQGAVTDRVARLGRQVANAFYTEVRARVAALHHWRREAVMRACRELALEVHPKPLGIL
jgi:hypothetical protein